MILLGNEIRAIVSFRKSIKTADYSGDKWNDDGSFFHQYSNRLSKAFLKHNVSVNFMVVGACDFSGENGVEGLVKRSSHWNGFLVEAVPVNFEDLNKKLREGKIDHRMHTLHGAVADYCEKSTVQFAFPTGYEIHTPNAPHWLRREIGFLYHVNSDKKDQIDHLNDKKNWKLMDVPCYTGSQILKKWRIQMRLKQKEQGTSPSMSSNLHVLMIDTEGSDANILTSLLSALPSSQLPLLILFEWKILSIEEQKNIVSLLLSRGYAMNLRDHKGRPRSSKKNDMFALLRPPRMRLEFIKNRDIGETIDA